MYGMNLHWCHIFLVVFVYGGTTILHLSYGQLEDDALKEKARNHFPPATKLKYYGDDVIELHPRGNIQWTKNVGIEIHESIALTDEHVVMKLDENKCLHVKVESTVKNLSVVHQVLLSSPEDLFVSFNEGVIDEVKLWHTGLYRFFCYDKSESPNSFTEYRYNLMVYENHNTTKPEVKWILSSELKQNESGSLTCKVTNGNPPPYLEIAFSQDISSSGLNGTVEAFIKHIMHIIKAGYESVSVHFNRFSIHDDIGNYTCIAHNRVGIVNQAARISMDSHTNSDLSIKTDDNKTVAVDTIDDHKTYLENYVSVNPSSAVVKTGGRLPLYLEVATKMPKKEIFATWLRMDSQKNIMPLPQGSRQVDNNLYIDHATAEMNGYFIVFVITVGQPMVSLKAKVSVQESFVFRDIWAFQGENVVMKLNQIGCELVGILNEHGNTIQAKDLKIIANTGVIEKANLSHVGLYSFFCNDYSFLEPFREYKFNLIVTERKNLEKPIVQWTTKSTLVSGRNESIVCHAIQGHPIPEMSVIRIRKSPLSHDADINHIEHLTQSSGLITVRLQPFRLPKDMATYECIGENRAGFDSEIIGMKLDESTYTSKTVIANVDRERSYGNYEDKLTSKRTSNMKLTPSILYLLNGDTGRIKVDFREISDTRVKTIWKMRDDTFRLQPLPSKMYQRANDLIIDCATQAMNGDFEAIIVSIGQPTVRLTAKVIVQPVYRIQDVKVKLMQPIIMNFNFRCCEDFKTNSSVKNITLVYLEHSASESDLLLKLDQAIIKRSEPWHTGVYTFYCYHLDKPLEYPRVYTFNVVVEGDSRLGDKISGVSFKTYEFSFRNGDNGTIPLTLNGSECGKPTVIWRKRSTLDNLLPLPYGMRQEQHDLQIDFATDEMTGEFVGVIICTGYDLKHMLVQITVRNLHQTKRINVSVHDRVVMRYNDLGCHNGKWSSSVSNLTVDHKDMHSSVDLWWLNSGRAIINRVEQWHAGIYTFYCFMYDATELASRTFQFVIDVGKIKVEKPVVKWLISNEFSPGEDSEAVCKVVKGYPRPTLEVLRKENLSPYSNMTTGHGDESISVHFKPFIIAEHSGRYICHAENEMGKDSVMFKAEVSRQTAPNIYLRKPDGHLLEDNAMYILVSKVGKVACLVSSVPPSLTRWYYKPFSSQGNDSPEWTEIRSVRNISDFVLELRNVTMIGHYRCTAEYQHKSFGIFFSFQTSHSLTIKPTGSIYVDEGGSAIISCFDYEHQVIPKWRFPKNIKPQISQEVQGDFSLLSFENVRLNQNGTIFTCGYEKYKEKHLVVMVRNVSSCRNDSHAIDYCVKCKSDEFECKSGKAKRFPFEKCIPIRWTCDNQEDCNNNADEKSCGTTRSCDQFRLVCRDGRRVEQRYVCDGEADCSDNDDEYNCKPPVIIDTKQPSFRDVERGSMARLSCEIISNSTPAVIWILNWRFPTRHKTELSCRSSTHFVSTLIIPMIDYEDEGIYNCEVITNQGNVIGPNKEVSIIRGDVEYMKFYLTVDGRRDIFVSQSLNLTATVTPSTDGTARFQWYNARDEKIPSSKLFRNRNIIMSSYSSPPLFSVSHGTWRVVATINEGTVDEVKLEKVFKINIFQHVPPTIRIVSEDMKSIWNNSIYWVRGAQRCVFQCIGSSGGTVNVRWMFKYLKQRIHQSGWKLVDSTDNKVIGVPKTGFYQCVAQNEYGDSKSVFTVRRIKEIEIEVYSMGDDVNLVFVEGYDAQIYCKAINISTGREAKNVTYKWTSPSFAEIAENYVMDGNILYLKKLRLGHKMNMECLVSKGSYDISQDFYVSVKKRTKFFLKMQLANLLTNQETLMTETPEQMVLNLTSRNSSVQIKCYVDAFPSPKYVRWRQCFDLNFCWDFSNQDLTHNLPLNLSYISKSDHQYRCQAGQSLKDGDDEKIIATTYKEVIINVFEAPIITSPKPDETLINKTMPTEETVFYSLVLICHVSSHFPSSTHSWTKDCGEIPSVAKVTYEYSHKTLTGYPIYHYEARLLIVARRLTPKMSGMYQFRIKNAVGKDSRKFHVLIGEDYPSRYKAYYLKRQNGLREVLPRIRLRHLFGELYNRSYVGVRSLFPTKVICSVDSLLRVTKLGWLWRYIKRYGDLPVDNPWRDVEHSSKINSTVTILTAASRLQYQCYAENEFGRSHVIIVTMDEKEKILLDITPLRKNYFIRKAYYFYEGDDLNLTCIARDAENKAQLTDVKYSWIFKRVQRNSSTRYNEDGNKLFIENIQPFTRTDIVCKARQGLYETIRRFIIIGRKRSVPIQLRLKDVVNGLETQMDNASAVMIVNVTSYNESLEFHCLWKGYPKPRKFVWKLCSTADCQHPLTQRTKVPGILKLQKITPDEQHFRCEAYQEITDVFPVKYITVYKDIHINVDSTESHRKGLGRTVENWQRRVHNLLIILLPCLPFLASSLSTSNI